MAIYPTPEQIEALLAGPADQPVVMVNLLCYKPRADPPDEGLTGAQAYARYAQAMREVVEAAGGRFLWLGTVDSIVIGDAGATLHAVGLVEYPSRRTFLELVQSPEVAAIGVHRAAGLESQWLIATTPQPL